MARKPVGGSIPPEEAPAMDTKAEDNADPQMEASSEEAPKAVAKEDLEPAPQPKWYVVTRGGKYHGNGYTSPIPTGKRLSDSAYDIKALIACGIVLQEIAE